MDLRLWKESEVVAKMFLLQRKEKTVRGLKDCVWKDWGLGGERKEMRYLQKVERLLWWELMPLSGVPVLV